MLGSGRNFNVKFFSTTIQLRSQVVLSRVPNAAVIGPRLLYVSDDHKSLFWCVILPTPWSFLRTCACRDTTDAQRIRRSALLPHSVSRNDTTGLTAHILCMMFARAQVEEGPKLLNITNITYASSHCPEILAPSNARFSLTLLIWATI